MKAVVYEDMAACTGILIAIGGIGLSYMTGLTLFDALASGLVGVLMGSIAASLIRMNYSLIIGKAVDKDIAEGIEMILRSQPSVEEVHSVYHSWEGPSSFSYKVEVDFRGSYFADQLVDIYLPKLNSLATDEDKIKLLRDYSEDITRMIEREVYRLQHAIRAKYKQAKYVEIQPQSILSRPTLDAELLSSRSPSPPSSP